MGIPIFVHNKKRFEVLEVPISSLPFRPKKLYFWNFIGLMKNGGIFFLIPMFSLGDLRQMSGICLEQCLQRCETVT